MSRSQPVWKIQTETQNASLTQSEAAVCLEGGSDVIYLNRKENGCGRISVAGVTAAFKRGVPAFSTCETLLLKSAFRICLSVMWHCGGHLSAILKTDNVRRGEVQEVRWMWNSAHQPQTLIDVVYMLVWTFTTSQEKQHRNAQVQLWRIVMRNKEQSSGVCSPFNPTWGYRSVWQGKELKSKEQSSTLSVSTYPGCWKRTGGLEVRDQSSLSCMWGNGRRGW